MSLPLEEIAQHLAGLYDKPFGGKEKGRYRVSPKMLRKIADRARLSDNFITKLIDELFEIGFVLLDLESYYVVTSVRTFTSYRRLGETSLESAEKAKSTRH